MTLSFSFKLALLCCILVLCNITWFYLGGHPQHWDSAIHLIESLNANRIGEQPDGSLLKQALSVSWYYPPFVSYVSIPVYRILGETEFAALQVMTFFLVLLVLSVYWLGAMLYGKEAGFLASLFVAAFPIVSEYSHTFMLDLPLAAMVTLAVCLFVRAGSFQSTMYCVLLGAVVGCGMLTKWTFATYAGVPLCYLCAKAIRASDKRRPIILNLMIVFLIATGIAAPWYLTHALQIATSRIEFLTNENRTFIESFLFYLKAIPEQTSLLLTIPLGLGIFFAIKKRRFEYLILVLWFVSGYFLNSFIGFKQPRHSISLLPPLALMSSMGLVGAFQHRQRIITALETFVLLAYLTVSFVPSNTFIGKLLSTSFMSYSILRVDGPEAQDWKASQILRAVEHDRMQSNKQRAVLRVIPDHVYFNNSTFQYFAKLYRYPIVVAGTSGFPLFTDYVLLKHPNIGLDSPEHEREYLTDTVLAMSKLSSSLFQKIEMIPLPDSSEGILLRCVPQSLPGFIAHDLELKTEQTLDQFVRKYFKPKEGYRISVSGFDSASTTAGRLKNIIIEIRKAEFGDFTFNPLGLPVSDVNIAISNVTLDPQSLFNKSEMKILSIEKLSLNSIAVAGTDLKAYIEQSTNGKVVVNKVEMNNGALTLAGYSQDIGARFTVILQLSLVGHKNIAFHFQEAKIGIVPLPAWLLNVVTDPFNPIITGLDFLSETHISGLRLDNDTLRIGQTVSSK